MFLLVETAIRIKNHTNRILAGDFSYRQAWVVHRDCSGSHNYGIDQGSESVESSNVSRTCDIVGMTSRRGASSIKTLSYLSDDQVVLQLKG
jgi:hypothetical protein